MARVLVIDDNPIDRSLLVSLLRHLGHDPAEAVDGADGVAQARSDAPDLVITDLAMPLVDGFEVANQIRSDPKLAATRVVLSTAAPVDGRLLELARACGVTAIIPKPSDPPETLRIIEESLASAPAASSPATLDLRYDERVAVLSEALTAKVEELKLANRRLEQSESRYRHLLDFAPNSIVGVDDRGCIALVNSLAEATFGYGRAELLGQPVEMLLPEEARPGHIEDRARYVKTSTIRPMGVGRQVLGRRKDGSTFPASVMLSSVEHEQETIVLASVHDLTERMEAEHQRARLEAQVQRAQRMEAVGELAGGVAHDFNNLLAVILSYASFLGDELPPGTTGYKDLERLRAAAERAAVLTRRLLVFSRREASTPTVLQLNDVILALQDLLEGAVGEQVTITSELAPQLPLINAHRGKIEQMLVNLVVNARDAIAADGQIRIETAAVPLGQDRPAGIDLPEGSYVRLTVRDTGRGIPKDVIDRVFEPFFTTKPRGEGTGLGLATVYGIVVEAGGGVTLSSEVGVGTVATVYLPAAESQILVPTGSAVPPEKGRGEKVLVVEDQEGVREACRRMLSANGYVVDTAATPNEALVHADGDPLQPQVLLTDLSMPGMSGIDLANLLASRWPQLVVLYMSGYADRTSADVLLRGGELLRKPFSRDELLRAVRTAIDASTAPSGDHN